MLIVIADDFSGAAEIAGISFRYGLRTELQLDFNNDSSAEVVVLDANTRSLSEADAIKRTEDIVSDLEKSGRSIRLFKKVDSVLRGHIIAEVNVLQRHFHFPRVLLAPANPVRGRVIAGGKYFVNGVELHKTVFANDPVFPATSSAINTIIDPYSSNLRHVHVDRGQMLPSLSLITSDIETTADLKALIKATHENDLCCGAAEFFEAYLEHLGYGVKVGNANAARALRRHTLIINGSTVKNPDEIALLKRSGIQFFPMPGRWNGDQFEITTDQINTWHAQISSALLAMKPVLVSIDLPIKYVKGASESFSDHFNALLHYLSHKIDMNAIHLWLTGGATASAIIQGMGLHTLSVVREVAPGVVTLAGSNSQTLFTVKPGSYSWPASFIEEITNEK